MITALILMAVVLAVLSVKVYELIGKVKGMKNIQPDSDEFKRIDYRIGLLSMQLRALANQYYDRAIIENERKRKAPKIKAKPSKPNTVRVINPTGKDSKGKGTKR